MKERTDRIATLVERYLHKELSSEEQTELDAWLAEGNENKALFQQLTDEAQLLERLRIYDLASGESMWEKTMSKIEPGAKVVQFSKKKIGWWKYAAAAAVVGVAAVYIITSNTGSEQTANKQQEVPVKTDEVVPGGNYAVLTKNDGSTVQLDKVANGDLGQEGPMRLTKTDGLLTYSGRFITSGPVSTGAEKHASLHNMVSTPRGGQYQITLPDGSRVWLNAASSLRFPLAFAGNQRIVEITGEAYFEVAKVMMPDGKTRMPFIVRVKDINHEVEVLGTHFNVKAYKEEENIKTTLLEGSVRVKHEALAKTIEPGQQALAQDGELKVISLDPEREVLWKDGFFNLEGQTETVIAQIARWYDVEIEYEGTHPQNKGGFQGQIPEDTKFSDMLKALEDQGIKTKLERRKLIIKQ